MNPPSSTKQNTELLASCHHINSLIVCPCSISMYIFITDYMCLFYKYVSVYYLFFCQAPTCWNVYSLFMLTVTVFVIWLIVTMCHIFVAVTMCHISVAVTMSHISVAVTMCHICAAVTVSIGMVITVCFVVYLLVKIYCLALLVTICIIWLAVTKNICQTLGFSLKPFCWKWSVSSSL